MLGKSPLASIIVLMMLAISINVRGVAPHEDFDSSEIDISSLRNYISIALGHLGSSLKAGSISDFPEAANQSVLFSDLVRRAQATLDRIPTNVDSYGYLNDYVWSMGMAEKNLSIMMGALSEHTAHISWLRSFSALEWTRISLTENLTSLDSAIRGLRVTRGLVIPACHNLDSNIKTIMDLELDIPAEAVSDLETITSGAESLPEDLTFGSYLGILFRPLMDEWSADLDRISLEQDPPKRIPSMIEILDPVLAGLSPELRDTIRSSSSVLEGASAMDMELRGQQVEFLSRFEDLNRSIAKNDDITDQLELLQKAMESLSDLYATMASEWESYTSVERYDTGTVNASLDAVSRLLDSYRLELEGLELVFKELNDLSVRLCSVLEMNFLAADRDNSGNLTNDEASGLSLPEVLDGLLIESSSILGSIRGIILDMDPKTASHYYSIIEGLRELNGTVARFCTTHQDFLWEITTYLGGSRSGATDLIGSVEDLSLMQVYLRGIGDSLRMLDGLGLDTDPDVNAKLEGQNGLFQELVLRLLDEAGAESSISLTIGEGDVPYDGSLDYGVIAFERRLDGRLRFINEGILTIALDGTDTSELIVQSGAAFSALTISREMIAGPHNISAAMRLPDGTVLSDSKGFSVRRIQTFVGCDPENLVLEPNEAGVIRVWIRDEFTRTVTGIVRYGTDSASVGAETTIDLIYTTTGKRSEPLDYPGDQWYNPSNILVRIDVSYGPVLTLSPELSVVLYGNDINLTWKMGRGSGDLSLGAGSIFLDVGMFGNGSEGNISIGSALLGMGNHTAVLRLDSGSAWCRDGGSSQVIISVLSPEEYSDWLNRTRPKPDEPEPEVPDDQTKPDQRPDQPMVSPEEGDSPWDFLPSGWLSDLITRSALFVVLGLFIASLCVLGLTYLRRNKPGRRPDAARIVEPIEPGTMKATPDVRRVERKGPRERLLHAYCDVIDATPGTGYHMTPREVSAHIIVKGADPATDPIPSFEYNIYSRDGPVDVNPIISGLRSLRAWISEKFRGGAA